MATIKIYDKICAIEGEQDVKFLWALDRELSFQVLGAEHTRAYKGYVNRDGEFVKWDGTNRLLSEKLTFATGLLKRVIEFYGERDLQIVDLREPKSVSSAIDIIPKLTSLGKHPYDYQIEAANATLKDDCGIIRISTGGGKCKSADSLNLTYSGMLTMEELGTNLQPGEYRELTMKVSTPLTKEQFDITSHIYRDGYGPSRLIKTRSGFQTQDTPAHRIKVLSDDGKMVWKRIRDVMVGDVIVMTKGQKVFGQKTDITEEDAYKLGMCSSSTDKEIPLAIRQSSKDIVAMFVRGVYESNGWVEKNPAICIALHSKKFAEQLHVLLLNFGVITSRRQTQTGHIVSIYRDYIPVFLETIGFHHNSDKLQRITSVMESSKHRKYNSNNDTIPNQHKSLERLSILCQKIFNQPRSNTVRSWCRGDREPSRRSITSYLSRVKIDLSTERQTGNVRSALKEINRLEQIINDTFYYDRVVSVEETISDNYDFVVPTTHSFTSQGMINHNTVVSSLITANFGKKTIIYVIGTDLMYQTHKFFSSVFDEPIGLIGDGNCEIHDINIASVWSVGQALGLKSSEILTESEDEKTLEPQKYRDIRDMLALTKVHIFDECHLAACRTIQEISQNINPEHIYGMSASPWRDDNADLLIECVLGKKIIDIPASYLIERGFLVRPIIKFVKTPELDVPMKSAYQTIYKNYIVDNPVRNGLVVRAATSLVEQGYQTLVLYSSVAHGKSLYQEISKHVPCALLSGKDPSDVREKTKSDLESGRINCIVASKIFDIGVDLPSLSGLVIASGGKSSVRALQRIGRVIRKFPNKKQAVVVDFYDQAKYLKDHSKDRRKIYSTEKAFEVIWPKNM